VELSQIRPTLMPSSIRFKTRINYSCIISSTTAATSSALGLEK
jgi:hypothetical protein